MQPFEYVTVSVDSQGVVTHRTPLSLVAHTGRYSCVHISGRGSLHTTASSFATGLPGSGLLQAIKPVAQSTMNNLVLKDIAEFIAGSLLDNVGQG
jgi:hypothetical protein